MRRNTIISIILIWFFAACSKEVYEKPKNLIKEKKMIDMMVDIHLAEATYFNQVYTTDATVRRLTSTDFYYSVLHKYNVPDSLFERSYIYYASKPKVFERMYRNVTNHLTEIEYEQTNLPNDALELEDSESPLSDINSDNSCGYLIIRNLKPILKEGGLFLICY